MDDEKRGDPDYDPDWYDHQMKDWESKHPGAYDPVAPKRPDPEPKRGLNPFFDPNDPMTPISDRFLGGKSSTKSDSNSRSMDLGDWGNARKQKTSRKRKKPVITRKSVEKSIKKIDKKISSIKTDDVKKVLKATEALVKFFSK